MHHLVQTTFLHFFHRQRIAGTITFTGRAAELWSFRCGLAGPLELSMAEHDEVYGKERADRLAAMLRALAERIQELDRNNALLKSVPELQQRLGDVRSELFHYEVRSTYDTPEVADSRRIVEDAQRGFTPDEPEDDEPWRRPRPGE
jgi:hypothetical protein